MAHSLMDLKCVCLKASPRAVRDDPISPSSSLLVMGSFSCGEASFFRMVRDEASARPSLDGVLSRGRGSARPVRHTK